MSESRLNEDLRERAMQACVVRAVEPEARLEVFLPKQDVALSLVAGHLSLAMAERWIETLDRYFQRGDSFRTFHDWEQMTSYDSKARRALTSWVVSSVKNVKSADFLVRDRLVRMGVSAASLATAVAGLRMDVHEERSSFEKALRRWV